MDCWILQKLFSKPATERDCVAAVAAEKKSGFVGGQ